MITRHKSNPIIKPSDVKPSIEGYKVLGTFNPGAIHFGDEIILLVRVSEGCKPPRKDISVRLYIGLSMECPIPIL